MASNPEFGFDINDVVTIVALELQGFIVQRCDHGAGKHTYLVIYWADGKRNDEWLHAREIR